MFKKIFKFIKGYVIITVTGKNTERFVNMCLYNGITLSGVKPCGNGLSMCLGVHDFRHIRRIVRKCGVRVRIESKHGAKVFAAKNRGRLGFVFCGAAVCIFFLAVPQYIWCVEINGTYDADPAEIEAVLREHGVYVGAPKKGIDDLSEIKNDAVHRIDGINWAWLYIEGAKARFEVQEITPAPEVADMETPTDIIAACDGVVRSAVVKRGERHVNSNMTVTAGQKLVSGKVAVFSEGYPEKYIYVHSRAEIMADTLRKASGTYSDTEELRVKTGSSKKRFSLELFGKRFDLFRDVSCGYEEYDTDESVYDLSRPFIGYIGISLRVYDVSEVSVSERKLGENEVLARAREELEEEICRSLGTGAVRTGQELSYSAENGVYDVELRMYLRENIGIEVPAEE